MTLGMTAIPCASASRAGGIALSGISMILDNTSVADSTRFVSSLAAIEDAEGNARNKTSNAGRIRGILVMAFFSFHVGSRPPIG